MLIWRKRKGNEKEKEGESSISNTISNNNFEEEDLAFKIQSCSSVSRYSDAKLP